MWTRIIKAKLQNPFNSTEQKASYETMQYIIDKGLVAPATKAYKEGGEASLQDYLFRTIPADFARDFHREEADFKTIGDLLVKENMV